MPHISAHPSPTNLLEWHFVVEGDKDSEYAGGIYHGKLVRCLRRTWHGAVGVVHAKGLLHCDHHVCVMPSCVRVHIYLLPSSSVSFACSLSARRSSHQVRALGTATGWKASSCLGSTVDLAAPDEVWTAGGWQSCSWHDGRGAGFTVQHMLESLTEDEGRSMHVRCVFVCTCLLACRVPIQAPQPLCGHTQWALCYQHKAVSVHDRLPP